jgi:hypothetical protein
MIAAAIQRPTTFERDNLLKSPGAGLDCRAGAYDIEFKARGRLRGVRE